MKKEILSAAALLTCSLSLSAQTIEPQQLVGKWQCQGSDEEVRVTGTVEYRADGKSASDVIISVPEDGHDLSYHVVTTGKWKLKDHVLEETAKATSVERRHSKKTQAWLDESEDNQLLDEMMYGGLELLLAAEKTETVEITHIDSKTMRQKGETFQAECKRL